MCMHMGSYKTVCAHYESDEDLFVALLLLSNTLNVFV